LRPARHRDDPRRRDRRATRRQPHRQPRRTAALAAGHAPRGRRQPAQAGARRERAPRRLPARRLLPARRTTRHTTRLRRPATGRPVGAARSRVRASTVEPKPVHWLWHPYIPLGKLTLVAGQPGQGKSLLTAWLAAHTTGRKGNVIMLSAE